MENKIKIFADPYKRFELDMTSMACGLFYLLKEHRKSFFVLLGHIFSDYFAKQFKRKPATYIDVPIDTEIKPIAGLVHVYLSFIPFLIGSLWFLKKEFKNRADEDIDALILSLKDIYSRTGFVFDQAPTVLADRRSSGLALQVLHLLDRPRNYFPSLHVILVSYIYFKVCELIHKHAGVSETYEPVKLRMFNRAANIIESCVLTKQHGLRDIAGGLAFVASEEREFGATAVSKFMDAIFAEKLFGMTDNLAERARLEIKTLYFDIISHIDEMSKNSYNHSHALVQYVHSIKQA